MKIVAISDLHGYLPEELPACDVVCIPGDIFPLNIQRDIKKCNKWYHNVFMAWVNNLHCKNVVLVGGNHDFYLQRLNSFTEGKLTYLFDSGTVIDGITFWGSPWVTGLDQWAFNLTEAEQTEKFSHIPDVDVLLTHTPPFLVGNVGRVDYMQGNPIDYGSIPLRNVLIDRDIKLNLFGHIHSGEHKPTKFESGYCVNCSILDEKYLLNYKPTIINIPNNMENIDFNIDNFNSNIKIV